MLTQICIKVQTCLMKESAKVSKFLFFPCCNVYYCSFMHCTIVNFLLGFAEFTVVDLGEGSGGKGLLFLIERPSFIRAPKKLGPHLIKRSESTTVIVTALYS